MNKINGKDWVFFFCIISAMLGNDILKIYHSLQLKNNQLPVHFAPKADVAEQVQHAPDALLKVAELTPSKKIHNFAKMEYKGGDKLRTKRRYIALTFDDGPHPIYTPMVLDVLKKYKAKATFFVLGSCVDAHGDLLKRIAEDGHEIEIHTYNHPSLVKISEADGIIEIKKTIAAIKRVIPDYQPLAVRPPYGATNKIVKEMINNLGLSQIVWSLDSEDCHRGIAFENIAQNLLKAQQGDIILLHDAGGKAMQRLNSIKALEQALPALLDNFQLVTLSHATYGNSKPYHEVTIEPEIILDTPSDSSVDLFGHLGDTDQTLFDSDVMSIDMPHPIAPKS
jgi:peptidoglycan/xylan/chitin deacetylase (PgdA/CDA1 family)